jgi:MerR family transcriptional regulator, heat shock protein HspR
MGGRSDRSKVRRSPEELGVYVISVAAELAGVHPQTLRMYERKGLISPKRTSGNSRRYSERDVEWVRRIQRLTQDEGINLAGVRMIIELQRELDRIQTQLKRARDATRSSEQESGRLRWGTLVRLRDVKNIFED